MSRFCKEKRSATYSERCKDADVSKRHVEVCIFCTFLMLQPHVCISYLYLDTIFSPGHTAVHCKVFVMTRFQINQALSDVAHCTAREHVDTWCEESVSQRVRAITEWLSWCVGDLNSSDRYNLLNQRSWILFNALYFWPFGVTMHKLGGSWQQ